MFAQVFVIAVFCIAASYQYTPFTECEQGPAPSALRVEGCTNSPCRFVRGSNVKAQWDFDVVADTDNMKPIVKAKVGGFVVDYPYPEQDACQSLTRGKCPLKQGDSVTYNLNMPVLSNYPKVSLHLTFSLVDKNNNVHACFGLNAKVVDSFLRS
ncbi:NPC intracellular cholesterol transporter 2 homolog a-like [Chelonus insularis]|uniref:NPC intracellular cholesterol transporter 2 homolog a-like n=1 Tax=Chelonus insularis TaxID=460826 RepID=UPI00158C5A82|nr:NPC intracellular cholesterol transporter 2 homolog a-like [Chelonus insularis]